VRSPYACQGVTNEDVRGPGNNGDSASPKLAWRILAGIGWSVLFCFLFLGVAFASFYIGHFVGKRTVSWVSPVLRGTVAISLILLLTWLIRVKVNGNSWVGIRLPRLQATRLLSGAACGACAILLVLGTEYLFGWIHFARMMWDPHSGIPNVWMIWLQLIPSVGTGFSEELTYRGYIFQTMAERTKVWVSALLSLFLFGLVHAFGTPGINVADILSIMTIGLSFLIMRFATGSLWFPIGFHAMFDWTQTYPLGMSAGSGPDPSLIQFHLSGPPVWVGSDTDPGLLYPASALLALGIALLYGRHKGMRIPWSRRLDANGQPC
jgi:membrane protease YdiL (CAAX protease family)